MMEIVAVHIDDRSFLFHFGGAMLSKCLPNVINPVPPIVFSLAATASTVRWWEASWKLNSRNFTLVRRH